jgi:hypothetical protein
LLPLPNNPRHSEGSDARSDEESPEYQTALAAKGNAVDYSRGFLLLSIVGMTEIEKVVGTTRKWQYGFYSY